MKLDSFYVATKIMEDIRYLKSVLACLEECGEYNAEMASINDISIYTKPNVISHVKLTPELLEKIKAVVESDIKDLEEEFYRL